MLEREFVIRRLTAYALSVAASVMRREVGGEVDSAAVTACAD